MYICNYCNRVFKNEYEICPACGCNSFKTKAYLGELVINKPPKDGYKLNTKTYEESLKSANLIIIFGAILVVFKILFIILLFLLGMYIESFLFLLFSMEIIPLIIGINKRKKSKTMIKKAKQLAITGILVKEIPYKVVSATTTLTGNDYKNIQVNFKNSAGVEIPLYSKIKSNNENIENETVDLLIDPNDYSNYFIDYEIY